MLMLTVDIFDIQEYEFDYLKKVDEFEIAFLHFSRFRL